MKSNAISSKTLRLLLTSSIIFYCLDYYFRIVPGLVIPELMTQYHTSPLGIGAFASAFYLGYVIMQIPGGLLLDRFSLKSVLCVTILLSTLTFILFLFSHQFTIGWTLRLLLGASSAFSFIAVLVITTQYLPEKLYTVISGITISAGTLAAAFAQSISAGLMHYFPWRELFGCLALAGVIIAFIIYRLNIPPIANRPAISGKAIRQEIARLLKKPHFVINAIIGGLFYVPTTILAAVWGVTFLHHTYALNKVQSATCILLLFMGWALGSPIMGWLANRVKHHQRIISCCAALAALLSAALLFFPIIMTTFIYSSFVWLGIFSSAQTLVWKTHFNTANKMMSGVSASLTNMIIMLCGSIFQLAVGALLTSHHSQAIGNFTHGLVIIPIVFLMSSLLAFAI